MAPVSQRSIAVLFENDAWMAPLFAALDAANLPFKRVFADDLLIDPAAGPDDALLVNKVSPSSYRRGHARSIQLARVLVAQYEAAGIPVVNGSAAYDLELSKAKQLSLLSRLGLPHPHTRVVNSPRGIIAAARELRFPVIVKPNIGGSGALMRVFEDTSTLVAESHSLDFGIDGVLLLQEFLPARDGWITRVEILDGSQLYAIRIETDRSLGFNLCPADLCQTPSAVESLDNCVIEVGKQQRRIERVDPPATILEEALAIARAGSLDVCGIEYLVDARTGAHVFYDINALSNFVADASRVVGFDPHERFVDYLAKRAGLRAAVAA